MDGKYGYGNFLIAGQNEVDYLGKNKINQRNLFYFVNTMDDMLTKIGHNLRFGYKLPGFLYQKCFILIKNFIFQAIPTNDK